jgi:hypothetical protein
MQAHFCHSFERHTLLNIESNSEADFEARLAQLSALWYLDWLLNLPVFLSLQAMKEESK